MTSFGLRFLISNMGITLLIAGLIFIKRLLKNILSKRAQYHLWFPLFFLLAVPFLPISFSESTGIFSRLIMHFSGTTSSGSENTSPLLLETIPNTAFKQINDYAVSVNQQVPSFLNLLLLFIWAIGMVIMFVSIIRSWRNLYFMEKSALPLKNETIAAIYMQCLSEMKIQKNIPIYCTDSINSPAIVGFIRPRIYIPVSFISDFVQNDIRYILLHELHHYKHKDTIVNHLINLSKIVYWFHPIIRYALKEIRCDSEIACDASVLQMLQDSEYISYGNTLIHFAEKVFFPPSPFASGIGGSKKQITRRIMSIAHFKKSTPFEKGRSIIAFFLITACILSSAPLLSTYASDCEQYNFEKNEQAILSLDLSSSFQNYTGSFVLYNENTDTWSIYNEENASTRVSPDSTYKIYSGLFALEEGIITPEQTLLPWDGTNYPFDEWNSDQNLYTAMSSSVNWYFQELDSRLGNDQLQKYYQHLHYGNENIIEDLSSYWMESSLKISPIEQVQLLRQLHNNSFNDITFSSSNIKTVKNSLLLTSSEKGSFYGKTGTGKVDGKEVNGWFIGFIETDTNTYYFATNLNAASDATGATAINITLEILSALNLWKLKL